MRIRIRASLSAARMRRVAWSPSSSGMRMSIRTTAGSKPGGLVDRLEPVARLGHHLDVLLACEQHPKAGAHHRLVVGDEHADRHGRSSPSGRRVLRTNPPSGRRACSHLATVDLDAFADADEPVPEAVARRAAPAVVAYLDLELVGPIADGRRRRQLARACLSALVRPS